MKCFNKIPYFFLVFFHLNLFAQEPEPRLSQRTQKFKIGLQDQMNGLSMPSSSQDPISFNHRLMLKLELGDKITKRIIDGEKFIMLTSLSSGAKLLVPLNSSSFLNIDGQYTKINVCDCEPGNLTFEGVNLGIKNIFKLSDQTKLILESRNTFAQKNFILPQSNSAGISPGAMSGDGLSMNSGGFGDTPENASPYPGSPSPFGSDMPIEFISLASYPQLLQVNKIISSENGATLVVGKNERFKFSIDGVIDVRNYNLITPNEKYTFIGPKLGVQVDINDTLTTKLSLKHQQNIGGPFDKVNISDSSFNLGLYGKHVGFDVNANVLKLDSPTAPTLYAPSISAGFEVKF